MSINIGNATGNNIELIKIEKEGIDNESDLILLKNDEYIVDNDNIFINYDNKFKTGIIETNSKYKYTITSNNNDTIGLYDSEEYIIQLDNDIINLKNNYINNIITKDFVIKNNTETEILKISNDTNKIIVKDNFDFEIELGTNEYNINSNNGINLVKFNSNIALFNYIIKVDKIQVKEIIPHDNESGVEIRSLSIVENIFDDINIGKTTELDNKKTPLVINKSILNDTEENNIIEINKYNNEYTDEVLKYDKILVLNNKGLLSLGKCENINSNNFININNYDNEYVYSNIETNINSNVNYIFNYDGSYLGDSFNINKYGNISIGDKEKENALLYINRNDDRLNLDDRNKQNYNSSNALLKLNLNYEEKNNYIWRIIDEKINYLNGIFINRYFEENNLANDDVYFINYRNNFKNVYTNINNQNNTELKEFFYMDENGDRYYFLNAIYITTLLDYKFKSLNLKLENNNNVKQTTVYDKTQTYNVKYDKLNLKNNNNQVEYDFKTETWLTSENGNYYRSHIFYPYMIVKNTENKEYNLELKLENIKNSVITEQNKLGITLTTHECFILYPDVKNIIPDENIPLEADIIDEKIQLINYLANEDPFTNVYTATELFNKLNNSDEEFIFKDFTVIGYTDDASKTVFAIYISKKVYEILKDYKQKFKNYKSSIISVPNFLEISSNNELISKMTSDGTIIYDMDVDIDISKDYSIHSKNKKGKFSVLETNKINSLENSDNTISFEYNNIINLGKVTFNENEKYILKNLDTSNITNTDNNYINYNDIVLNINKLDNIKEYSKTLQYSNIFTNLDNILYPDNYYNNIINIDTHLDNKVHPSISIYGSNPNYILKSTESDTTYYTGIKNKNFKNITNGIIDNNKIETYEISYINDVDYYKTDIKSLELNSKHILQYIGTEYDVITLGENYNICIDNKGPIPTKYNDENFGTLWINVGTTRPSYGNEINNELLKNKINENNGIISLQDLETIKTELGIIHFEFDNYIKKDNNYYVIYSNTHTELLSNNTSNSSFKMSLGIPFKDNRINNEFEGYRYNFPKYFKEIIKENSDYMLNIYGNTKIIGIDGETNGLSVKINDNKSLIDNKYKVNLSVGKEVVEDINNNRFDIDGDIYVNNLYYKNILNETININNISDIIKQDIINNIFHEELSKSEIHTSNINNKQDNGIFDIKLLPKIPISNLLTPEAPYIEKKVKDYNQPLVNNVIISNNNNIYKRQFPSAIDYSSDIINDVYNGYHYYYFNSINNEDTTYNLIINDSIICDVLIVGGGGGGGSFQIGKYWLNIGSERPSGDINLITLNDITDVNIYNAILNLIEELGKDDMIEINSVKIINNWDTSYGIVLTEESYIYSNGNYFKTTVGAGGDGGQQILLESLTIEKDTSFDIIVGKGGNGSGFTDYRQSDSVAEVGGISKFNNITANYGQKISNFRGIGQNGNINIGQKAYNIFNIVYENLGSNQNNIKYFAGQGGSYNTLGGIGGGGVLIDSNISDINNIETGDATVIGSGGGYSQNGGWGNGKEGIVILRYKFSIKEDTFLEQIPLSDLENTYLEYNWQLNDWILNPYVGNTYNLLSSNITNISNNLINNINENKNYVNDIYILSSNNNVYSNISSSNYTNNIDNKLLLLNNNTSNYIKNIEYNLNNNNASNIKSGILNIDVLPKIPFSKFYNLELSTLYSPRINHNIVETTEYYSSNIDYSVYDINNIKYCDYILLNYNDSNINISQQTNYLLEFQYDCKIDILIVGGGGGGGGTQSINAGGGGGGGVIYVKDVDIERGKSYNIKVGNGGNANKDGYDTEAFGLIARGGKKGKSDTNTSLGEGGLGGNINILSGITEVQGKIVFAQNGGKGGTSSRISEVDVKGGTGVPSNIYYNREDGYINSLFYWGGGGGATRWNNNGNENISLAEGLRYGELPSGGLGGGGSGAFKYNNSVSNTLEYEKSEGGTGYNNGETIEVNITDNLLYKRGGNGGKGTGGGGGGGFDTIYDDNISGSGGIGGSGIVIIKYYDINIPDVGERSKGYLSYDYNAEKWNMNSLDLINLDINIDNVYDTITTTGNNLTSYIDSKFTNAGAPLSYIVVPKSFITNDSISDLTIGSENIIGYMGKSSNYDSNLTQTEIDLLVDENGLLTLSNDAYINESNIYYKHLIKGSKFKFNSITNSNIADNTITDDKLFGQIDGSKIKNATVEFSFINGVIDAPITIINTLNSSNLNANLITKANIDISLIDFTEDKKLLGITNIVSENNLIKIPINNFENIEIDINNIDISSNILGKTKVISDTSNIPLNIFNDVIIDVINIEKYGTEEFKLDSVILNGDIPINSIVNINVPIKNISSTSLINTNSTLIYNGPSGLKWKYVSNDINNLVANYNLIVNNYLKNKIRKYYLTYISTITITLNTDETITELIDETKYINVDDILYYTTDTNNLEWNFLSYNDIVYNISNTYEVSIETINGNNYYKFGNLSYNEYEYLGFEIGEITLTNIPIEHPIGFLIDDSDTLEVITLANTNLVGTLTIEGIIVNFYSGDIKLNIKQNFTSLSYYCYYHGYMGGEKRIKIKNENKTLINNEFLENKIRESIQNIYNLNNLIILTQDDLINLNFNNLENNNYIYINNTYFGLYDESKIPPNYIRNLNLSADQIDTTIDGSFLQNVNLTFDNAKLDPKILGQISVSPDDIDFVPGSLNIDLITNIEPSGLKWINIGTEEPSYGQFIGNTLENLTILTDKLLPYGNITYLTDVEWESIRPENFILSHMDYVYKLIDGVLNYYRPTNGLLDPRFVGTFIVTPSQIDSYDNNYTYKLENIIIDTTSNNLDPRIIGNLRIKPEQIDTNNNIYTYKLQNVEIDTTSNLINPELIGNLVLKAEQLNNVGLIGSVTLSDLSEESIDPSLISNNSIVIDASNLKVGNGYKLPETLNYNFTENSIHPSLLPDNIEISGIMIDTTNSNNKLENVIITGNIDTSNIGLNAKIASSAIITSLYGDKINSVSIETEIDASIINNATIVDTATIKSINGSKISGRTYIYGQDINPAIINDAIINIDNQSTSILTTTSNTFTGDTILSGTIDASLINNVNIIVDENTNFKANSKISGTTTITGIVSGENIGDAFVLDLLTQISGSNIQNQTISEDKISSNINLLVNKVIFSDGTSINTNFENNYYTTDYINSNLVTKDELSSLYYEIDIETNSLKVPITIQNIPLYINTPFVVTPVEFNEYGYPINFILKLSTKDNFISLINDKALLILESLNLNTSITLESYYTEDYGTNNIGEKNKILESDGGSVLKLSNSRFSILVNSDGTLNGTTTLQNTMEFSNSANYSHKDLYVPKLVFNDGTSMTTAAISLLDVNKQLIMNNTSSGFNYDDSLVTGEGFIHCNGLHAEFDITAYSSTTQSDKRLKKDIKNIEYNDEILKLNPVSFKWNDVNKSNTSNVGFIAQELEEILPNLVKDGYDSYKSVNYTGLIPYLVKHIQKLENRIVDLEKKINN
jgi:hypothetical protein